MIDPIQLEDAYHEFSENLRKWIPDGIISVNMNLLHDIGLLSTEKLEAGTSDSLTHLFHVLETAEKVTLYNEQFAIWIVPRLVDNVTSTLTYIALLNQNKPHLEIVFSTSGVYNSPKYILKILQYYLIEVTDTEAIISSIGKKK